MISELNRHTLNADIAAEFNKRVDGARNCCTYFATVAGFYWAGDCFDYSR